VLNMKITALLFLFFLISGPLISQDTKSHIVTKTFYNKWNVTYSDEQLFEYYRGSDTRNGTQNGITILYFAPTMIDDGIYGTEGIILTKEKAPEYVLGLSFPVGIGNKSYEELANDTMSIRILLTSGKDSVFNAVSYESTEDQVTVGGNDDLLSRTLIARDLNWIAIESLTEPLRVSAKIRHRHEPAPAVLENAPNGEVRVIFDEPQRAITPGQAVVFYQDDLVVGGGWIAETAR